jgi:acetyl esterase/lipase
MSCNPRPPYDSELATALAAMNFSSTVTIGMIGNVREKSAPSCEQALEGRAVGHKERKISGPLGDILLSIIRSTAGQSSAMNYPGIFYAHGGGMIAGNRFLGIGVVLDWVEEHNATCVSVEYRLPPEHPDPALLEDCYAALLWVHEHSDELRIDSKKLMIVGPSAGG